jgi:hypothetical protein
MMMGMATKSLQLPEDKGVRFYRSTSCICMVKLHVFAHFFYLHVFFICMKLCRQLRFLRSSSCICIWWEWPKNLRVPDIICGLYVPLVLCLSNIKEIRASLVSYGSYMCWKLAPLISYVPYMSLLFCVWVGYMEEKGTNTPSSSLE